MEEIKKVITVDTSKGVKSIKSLRDEVSKLTNELEDLEIGSKEYVNKLDDLVEAQKDLTAVTESMEGRTVNALKAFDSINQVAGGLAAGISAVSATFTLFGKDTEELDKVMVKLQASIAIVQGIGGLKGLGEGIINATKAFKALSVSIVATGTATKGAAVAMRGLKAALVSTGIGALVVAVGFLIEKLLTLKSTAYDAFTEFQNTYSVLIDKVLENSEILQGRIEFKRDVALAKGLDEEYNIWMQYYEDVINLNKNLQKNLGDYKNKFIEDLAELTDGSRKSRKAFESITEGVDFGDPEQLDKFVSRFKDKIGEYSILVKSLNESQKASFDVLVENFIKADTEYNNATNNILQATKDSYLKTIEEYNDAQKELDDTEAEYKAKRKAKIDEWAGIVNEGYAEIDKLYSDEFDELLNKYKTYYDALDNLFKEGAITEEEYNKARLDFSKAYSKEYQDIKNEQYKTDLENQLAYLQEMQSRESMLFDNQISNLSNEYQGQQRTKVWTRDYYQSTSDVNTEYQNTVTYNNEYLKLITDRINRENDLLDQQQLVLNEKYNAKLITEQEYATQSESISLQLAANEAAIEAESLRTTEANTDAYIALQEKKNQAIQSTINVASSLTGALANVYKQESQDSSKSQKEQEKAFKTYKALAITQAIIDTASSAQGAYKAMVGIPYVGPFLAPVAAAAAVLVGLANIKAIQNEQLAGTSTSGDSGASASIAKEAVTLSPVGYTRNLLGDKETDALNQPTKVYVLEQDVTNAQAKVKVTESNASF